MSGYCCSAISLPIIPTCFDAAAGRKHQPAATARSRASRRDVQVFVLDNCVLLRIGRNICLRPQCLEVAGVGDLTIFVLPAESNLCRTKIPAEVSDRSFWM